MSRPRKTEHHREAILEAGAELFSSQGYNGTGLKAILDAVKVPKGSFYNYFESKEHFAAEVIRNYIATLITRFEGFVAQSDASAVDKIKQAYALMIEEMLGCEVRKGCLLGNLAMEVADESASCRSALREGFRRWKDLFIQLVQEAQSEGDLRKDLSAEEISDVFWAAWEGSILRARIEGKPEVLKQMVPFMLDRVLGPIPQ